MLNNETATGGDNMGVGDQRERTVFLSCESGATSIEYAVMVAGIAVVIVSAVYALGGTTLGLYESVQAAFDLVMN